MVRFWSKSSQNGSKIVQKSFKIGPGGGPTPSKLLPRGRFRTRATKKSKCADFWRFWEGSWDPKTTKNRQKSTLEGGQIWICFRTSFLIDFGGVFASKMESEIEVFGVRSSVRRIWSETSKFGDSTTLLDVFRRSGALKIHQKSIKKRSKNEAGFATRFGPRFGTVFGRFWGPKSIKN